jgi:hypothetical protein
MNVIGPRIHGILDYATVVFFLLAPTLFSGSLTGANGLATVCYLLAVAHFAMTILTDFPLGMVEVIALGVHGVIELIASIALIAVPWILGDLFWGARVFFTCVGAALFLVWVLSDYTATPQSTKTSPKPKTGAADAPAADAASSSASPEAERDARDA